MPHDSPADRDGENRPVHRRAVLKSAGALGVLGVLPTTATATASAGGDEETTCGCDERSWPADATGQVDIPPGVGTPDCPVEYTIRTSGWLRNPSTDPKAQYADDFYVQVSGKLVGGGGIKLLFAGAIEHFELNVPDDAPPNAGGDIRIALRPDGPGGW